MSDESYWVPAAASWAALACKLPALARTPRDPLLRTACAVLGLAGTAFVAASPSAIGFVNRLTDTPNAGAPCVYSLIIALSGACLVLVVHWRGGTAARVRRTARRWTLAFAVVIALLAMLFTLGDAPVEHRLDLDTYYATTPFIREMIVLYLVVHAAASAALVVVCRRWSARVSQCWLRRGLRLIVLGYVLNLTFATVKFAAVSARWAGADWDVLSTRVAPPAAAVGTLCVAGGFTLPLISSRIASLRTTLDNYRTWRLLGPLWNELRTATPAIVAPVCVPWWAVSLRLTRRIAEIHDGLLALRPHYDGANATRRAGSGRTAAAVPAVAALPELSTAQATIALRTAIRNKSAGRRPAPVHEAAGRAFSLAQPLHIDSLIQISRTLPATTRPGNACS